ncbi:endonuclease/exonuclease/phosphatase family protein [Flavobacterium sp. D11R37]|uniref:endonuclease/exonuclease/phosphatase family protein n=1 Tax=Flavobacterium coralii TaxID=2838017 RepID=UPI001CA77F20|nr:endonuclease/exonuclease/phosphatase family protein [Flavobacterium coralii]MBY8961393.1 endonuclease/exonuclease/phosphatase family protein [Flavobacterium coralii]
MKFITRNMSVALILTVVTFTATEAQTIKVMSYNIRLDHAGDGDNRWDNRKEQLAGQVKFYEPDFMGVQEALPNQMAYLLSQFNNQYDAIGVGRDDGANKGEYSAIFYNTQKYKLLRQSTFWLSETPDVPSTGWDAALNRICTYGLFQDKQNGKKIWVFNTHFDHVGEKARAESAKLILQKIKEVNKDNLPFVLTGDFNLKPDSEPVTIIKQQLNDTKDVASLVFGPEGTFNAFEFTKPVTRRIDYIFVPKSMEVKKYAVLSDSQNCRYLSDHLPVYAELELQ